MGIRALQVLMIVLLVGCFGWSSAIFFGPWALTKYLESQAGDAIEVSGLKVTPKLAVTASRVQMSDRGAVIASFRGVEVDWRLLRDDAPAVLISVSNGAFAGSLSIEDLQVTVALAENGDPLKISGTAARAVDSNSFSALDVKFDAHTDYNFNTLRRVTATTGELTDEYPSRVTASNGQFEIHQLELGAALLKQDLGGTLALTSLGVAWSELSIPKAVIKFASAVGLVSLTLDAQDLLSHTSGVTIGSLTGSMEYDAVLLRPAGPIELALNDFAWKYIRLQSANTTVTQGDDQFKISGGGESLGSEITIGRRYIGRIPEASFNARFDVSSVGDNLRLSGEARLAAAQQPVELDLSFQGAVAGVSQPMVCTEVDCEISDVTYLYSLNVAGETLSGTSSCMEPTCSSGGRTHELATTDTNKFFANLQGVNLISPLVLGGAYAQMLQGVAVGAGHKINF